MVALQAHDIGGVRLKRSIILNFAAGQTIANSTVVGVSADGRISLFNSYGSTHVVVDVSGWFPTGGAFTADAMKKPAQRAG